MSVCLRFVCLLIGVQLMSIELVLSSILCKDSRIDSITYANDKKMYFFTSGGYYWWISENDFPPKDSEAKRLPSPFIMGQAAVYVDSVSGCGSVTKTTENIGVRPFEKEVWVEEYVGGQHKLLAFDTKLGKWSNQTIVYNQDHCISYARIDWSSGRQLDAMFVRNFLQIYFVQGDKYAMVDCSYLCTAPNDFGDDKEVHQIKDLQIHSSEPIYATFVMRNKVLFVFHISTYYGLTIQPNSRKGKLVTKKDSEVKNIIKDFFKIDTPSKCIEPTTTQLITTAVIPNQQPVESIPQTMEPPALEPGEDSPKNTESPKASGGMGSTIVIILIVLLLLTVSGVIAYFVIKSKTSNSGPSDKEKAETNKQNPSTVDSKGKVSSKVGSKGLAASNASTITNKSNKAVVASRSDVSKTSQKK